MSDKRDFVISDSEINPMFKIEVSKTPEPNFTFNCGDTEEVMRLDKDGMTYKGQRIEDGGEAHKAFMEVMEIMRNRRGSATTESPNDIGRPVEPEEVYSPHTEVR